MNSPRGIRAVTFDAGGTLIEPWPSVGHVYAAVAGEHGVRCEAEMLNQQFRAAWERKSIFEYSRQHWLDLVEQTFAGITSVPTPIFEAIYDRFALPSAWRLYDDVVPTLTVLRKAGVKMAVISNWDERLRGLLDQFDLCRYFESILISTEVRAHKPARTIFALAAEKLGCEPGEILHVGDSLAEDITGAHEAGMHARRIRRNAQPEHEFDISDLRELASMAAQAQWR